MTVKEILSRCDHTLLSQTATLNDIKALCDDGIKYAVASVCIPACFVKDAKEYVGDKLKICTVIGFPNGYSTTEAKCFEAADAVKNGADEIDMVVNIGWVKERRRAAILSEINAVKKACAGRLLRSSSRPVSWTRPKKYSCAASCRIRTPNTSKPPQGFQRAVRPRRTSL